jgi:hypothetical protein
MSFQDQESRDLCRKLILQGKDTTDIANALGNRGTKDDIYGLRNRMKHNGELGSDVTSKPPRKRRQKAGPSAPGTLPSILPAASTRIVGLTKEELVQVHGALQAAADLMLKKLVAIITS